MEQHHGGNYRNIFQPPIITKILKTFLGLEMPTIIPDTSAKRPKMHRKITYLEKNNIYKAIRKKLRKKDVYETDMHKIYNLIMGQTNKKSQ